MTVISHPNIASVIELFARTDPKREALLFEGGPALADVCRSYGDLWRNAQRLARGLSRRGVGPGSVIALLMANHAEFVELMIATALLGAVLVPIDPRTRGEKLAFMISNSKATGIIAADYALHNIEEVMDAGASVDWIVALATDEGPSPEKWGPRIEDYAHLTIEGEDLPVPLDNGHEVMQIIHTSGTTGDPKGIVLTHRRFCETGAAAMQGFGYRPDDRLYSGLSLTHANALLVTLAPALLGGMRVVFSRRFTRSRLWEITRRHQCTTFTLLGGMTTALYAAPAHPDDADNPVRFVVSAGMPAAIWEQFEQRFGVKVLEFYGSAEGGLALNPIGGGPVGSIGRVAPYLAHRIVDDAGRDVPRGTPGELLVQPADGTPFQVEYVGNPEASAKKGAGGWLHMGDVVREDADGWLFFEYRKGGGIRRNGDFIATAYVEKAIAESGLVSDVYVYGVPASSSAPGEKDLVAAVVPLVDKEFDAQALFRRCREALEANFVPSFIQVVGEIPKTASEKPQERFLVEALAAAPQYVYTEDKAANARADARRTVV
ncbi:AMP-binding protein [Diaphorobacter ruginosibacter]|uniref:AMP-binding protein n=1 Tax=Diaphorobacter ruginosibacter TaxID=1715720 RepID=A0A7G9RU41_9BURK|nr:AMP-binding protein [Diaphorobacter ruginosibacter]QNN59116.1 AMP-binding protein [Diaphorobacter ruginosibacter]